MKEVAMKYDLERVADITEADPEQIKRVAIEYAKAENAAIVYSLGITEHSHGADNVMSTANLAMLTGNLGKIGGGVNPLRGQNNVQGACDMGALPVTKKLQTLKLPKNSQKLTKSTYQPLLV